MKLQEKLSALQEEKHQLFLQLKKVLHEEEKRRRKEQRCGQIAKTNILQWSGPGDKGGLLNCLPFLQ